MNKNKEPLKPGSHRFPEYPREMSSDKSDAKLEIASMRDIKQGLEQLLLRSIVPALQDAVNEDIQKVSPI